MTTLIHKAIEKTLANLLKQKIEAVVLEPSKRAFTNLNGTGDEVAGRLEKLADKHLSLIHI